MNTTSLRLRPSVALVKVGLLLAITTGCTVGPKYVRPTIPAPPAYRGADEVPVSSADQESLGDQKWAQVFHEPKLQDLIRAALENNFDVRIAAQRVLEAQAQLRITRSQQFPTVTVGGTGIGAELGTLVGNGLPTGAVAAGFFTLSAAWTPDFWGLYRRQTEAERAQLLSQVWAQRAVRITLVQQVSTAYLHLRSLDEQLAIAKETLKARQESTDLTRTLESAGSVPLADLRQAEELEYAASVQVPQLEQQIQQEENSIRLLLGKNPGTVDRAEPNALTPVPQDLPVGLPSRLLERRPDIRRAEQQLVAANARIGVARAQFFPQLSITGSGGVGGSDFSTIFDADSRLIYGIGALTQPIFQGGKLRGQLRLSEETKKEMVLNYQQTIAGAFRDASNALIAVKKQRTSREQQEKLVAAAQDAVRLARIRYQAGATNYLEVLTTDSNLFTAQLNLVNSREGEAQSLVQLYAALGGGWE
ncbi:MAG TPA: efflux transporter outer membrane subunit [Candidatus Sulfotelmatobacter sp.]